MKQQSTTKGFAVLSAAQIISKVLSLLYLPLLINILQDKAFGIYGSTYIIFQFMYVITNSGIPVAISKIMSELIAVGNYKDAIKSFKMARAILILLGIVMSLLMYFFAYSLASITNSASSRLAIKALAPTIFFTSVVTSYRGYFQGRSNMTPTAISQIIEQITNIIFSLMFAALFIKYGPEYGAAGGTVGTSLGALVAAIYLYAVYKKNKYIKVSKVYNDSEVKRYSNKKLLKKILNYSIPMTICIGIQNAGNLVDLGNVKSRLIVAGLSNIKEDLFGWLTKYNSLINVPIAIISCLCVALLPSISGAAALNDKVSVEKKINYAFRLSFFISVPSAVGLAVLSKPIYQLLNIRGGYQLLLIGSSVVVLMSMVQIQTTILQGIGKLYIVTLYAVLGLSVKITINYILVAIPEININGAILGNVVSFLIPLTLNYFVINRTLHIKVRLFKNLKKPLEASFLMSVAVLLTYILTYNTTVVFGKYISNALACVISIIVGILIYLLALIKLKGITKNDLNAIPQKILRLIPNRILEMIK